MAYKKVDSINKVSPGFNYIVGGAIMMRIIDESIYACIDENYYKFSKEGFEMGDHLKSRLYEYGVRNLHIDARFLAYKLVENGSQSLYLTINSKKTDKPIMVYQEYSSSNDESKIVNFCFLPEKEEDERLYKGQIGWISEDLYLTALNKSRLLERPLPKSDYVKKAIALKNKIEKCKIIPMAYSLEHENIYIPDVFPQEMNKLHLVSKLRNAIENYGSAKIYYSEVLKKTEEKYKAILQYFKYNDMAS